MTELVTALRERGMYVATAESLTGGLLGAAITAVPGSSTVYRGGVVAYDARIKQALLGVDGQLLAERGAVDADVARQMADGVVALMRAGEERMIGIATTGIAGPDSPDGQPVGTVHVAVGGSAGSRHERLVLGGDRDRIRRDTVRAALALALETALRA